MIAEGTKVKFFNPQTKSKTWRKGEGTVVSVLKGNNSFTGKEVDIHIVKCGGRTCPIEEKYLKVI